MADGSISMRGRFKQTDRIVLRENPAFDKVCTEFHFSCGSGKGDSILFTNRHKIFKLNIKIGDI